jgi:cytochrome c5
MKRTLVFSLLAALVGMACGVKKSTNASVSTGFSTEQVKQAETRFPGITSTELAEGKKLYESRCSSCHELPHAEKMSQGRWAHEYASMKGPSKANLNFVEDRLVNAYVSGILVP